MSRFRACAPLRGKRVDGRWLALPPSIRLKGTIIYSSSDPSGTARIKRLWADGVEIPLPVQNAQVAAVDS